MTDGSATQEFSPAFSLGETREESKTLPPVWKDSEWLRLEVTAATLHFVERERAVWFPKLGIFFPVTATTPVIKGTGSRLVVQRETVRSVRFEKCSELVAFQRQQFPTIVELPELVDKVHSKLSQKQKTQISSKELRANVLGLISDVRRDVLRSGCSRLLPGLGTLYALHNRQGDHEVDWFAGADIFLIDGYQRTLRIDPPVFLERPVLRDAFEIFEAAYGARLSEESLTLGGADGRSVTLATFHLPHPEKPRTLIVTDGLRSCAGQRAELVLEVEDEQGVIWARTLLRTLCKADGGTLIASLSRGTILELPAVLRPSLPAGARRDATSVESLAVVPYPRSAESHRTEQETFTYRLCLGITRDEAQFAEHTALATLLSVLERRGFCPTTKLVRQSVLRRSSFESEPTTASPRRT